MLPEVSTWPETVVVFTGKWGSIAQSTALVSDDIQRFSESEDLFSALLIMSIAGLWISPNTSLRHFFKKN